MSPYYVTKYCNRVLSLFCHKLYFSSTLNLKITAVEIVSLCVSVILFVSFVCFLWFMDGLTQTIISQQ